MSTDWALLKHIECEHNVELNAVEWEWSGSSGVIVAKSDSISHMVHVLCSSGQPPDRLS
jgi:hypothetical protein